MKDTLSEIFSKFGHSKAVFNVVSKDDDKVYFKLKEEYNPRTADLNHNDIVVKMAVECYRESFDKYQLFTSKQNSNAVISEMYQRILQAFENASPLRNPRVSKLYKWLSYDVMTSTLARREGLIALFKYVHEHTDDGRFSGGSTNTHAQNLVAILEKMKEKYERK